MTDEVLTQRRLNRALLSRQLLLERAEVSIPDAVDRLAGIQNQYAPNAYIRLWSCVAGFQHDQLTRAYEDGSVVQGTLMRGTIHAVSATDYRLLVGAIREELRRWAMRIYRGDDSEREALVARVRDALRGRSVPRRELTALRAGAGDAAWSTLDTDAELLRVPPSGTWERRRADIYGLADDWIGAGAVPPSAQGMEHLVRRYLGGFGPASPADIAAFTGIPVTPLKPILAGMELRTFRDEAGRALLDVAGASLPPADTPAPVRFLPTWDAALLVHARRTLVLPEEYRPLIFHTRMPPSYPTFLVDGQVAGTWRFDAGRIELTAFRELRAAERRQLDEEAERLAVFHAA